MEKTKQKQITDFLINNGVIIVMFILVIVAGLTTQNFFTLNNLNNLLNNMSFRLVIALGIAGCVITAGCDLSAGRLIGLGGCISGVLLQRMDYSGKFFPDMQPLNVFLAALVAMLICAVFGTITGFFIAYLSVPPFIATLATMEIVYGLNMLFTNATPLGGFTTEYTNVGSGKFLGMDRTGCSSYYLVHLQYDPSWKIYVCNRWKPTGSRGCRCSGKTDPDPDLYESSSYVWSCRIHAGCKIRWCFRTAWLWL